MGSMLYSKPRKLNQLTIYHRHLGQLKEGGALGLSLFFLVQSYKAQAGGISRTIRGNVPSMILFANKNQKMLDEIAEELAGEVSPEVFHKVFKQAIQDKHDFLFVDLHRKPNHPSAFRRNLDTFLIPEYFFCNPTVSHGRDLYRSTAFCGTDHRSPHRSTQDRGSEKPRSEAQLKALEAARAKALELRAQKTAARATEVQKATEVPRTEAPPEPPPAEEPQEDVQYVRKARSKTKPKKKRVIVVEESSSSDSEIVIEVRLPKRKDVKAPAEPPPPKDPNQVRFDRAYEKMFAI
jgi:hypothetical protein